MGGERKIGDAYGKLLGSGETQRMGLLERKRASKVTVGGAGLRLTGKIEASRKKSEGATIINIGSHDESAVGQGGASDESARSRNGVAMNRLGS